jgi:predicted 3-demethylubiquinone-9 3-methyltransferase (glyoxalase superfamily)
MASLAPHHTLTPCLWFDHQAEDAAQFYVDIFPRSCISRVLRYGEVGREVHGRAPGSVMTVAFELDGQGFTALNGGPVFRFNEAISLQVHCDTQAEVDHYWARLSEGGDPAAQNCGWLKDRYGLSWQVVPRRLVELIADVDAARANRVFGAMLQMRKLDIATLEAA